MQPSLPMRRVTLSPHQKWAQFPPCRNLPVSHRRRRFFLLVCARRRAMRLDTSSGESRGGDARPTQLTPRPRVGLAGTSSRYGRHCDWTDEGHRQEFTSREWQDSSWWASQRLRWVDQADRVLNAPRQRGAPRRTPGPPAWQSRPHHPWSPIAGMAASSKIATTKMVGASAMGVVTSEKVAGKISGTLIFSCLDTSTSSSATRSIAALWFLS